MVVNIASCYIASNYKGRTRNELAQKNPSQAGEGFLFSCKRLLSFEVEILVSHVLGNQHSTECYSTCCQDKLCRAHTAGAL